MTSGTQSVGVYPRNCGHMTLGTGFGLGCQPETPGHVTPEAESEVSQLGDSGHVIPGTVCVTL